MAHPKGRTGWYHTEHQTQREFERIGNRVGFNDAAINALAGILGISPEALKNGNDDSNGNGLWALTVFIENKHLIKPKVVQGLNFNNRRAKPSDPDFPLAYLPIEFNGKNSQLEKKYRTFDNAEKSNIDAWASLPLWDLLDIEGPMSVQVTTEIRDLKQFGMKGKSKRNTVKFVNDEVQPGSLHYYGTEEGADPDKGWYPLSGLKLGRLEVTFDYNDFNAGEIVIGAIPADKRVFKASLLINIDFNDDATLTIGDDIGVARLQTINDSQLNVAKSYDVENEFLYEDETELKVYPTTGTPTQGEGTIIIYYL
jgi:hypothetical protein